MPERQESGKNIEKTHVYRAFDAAGQLLYVGMTKDLWTRFVQHQSKHWIWNVASITADVYWTRAEAREAEKHAIRTEAPRWNVWHTPDWRKASKEYWAVERTRHTDAWPTHSSEESIILSRRLRRMIWPIQYGIKLSPLTEAGEFIYYP